MLLETLGRRANPRKDGSDKEASSLVCLEIPLKPPFGPQLQMCRGELKEPDRRTTARVVRRLSRDVAAAHRRKSRVWSWSPAPPSWRGVPDVTPWASAESSERPGLAGEDCLPEVQVGPSRIPPTTCKTSVWVTVHYLNALQRR